jgi:hypothetical protein
MVQIYNEITIYIYKAIFPSGASPPNPLDLTGGYPPPPPSALPHVEECTYFWGVKSSWGINTVEKHKTYESGR